MRLGIGFLIVVGAPPCLIYDVHRIARGQADFFNWLMFVGAGCLVILSLFWLLQLKGEEYLQWKSIWERPVALAALIVSSPVLLISALLIKLESPGPTVYHQERIGHNKRREDRRRTTVANGPPPLPERRKSGRRKEDLGGKPFVIYKLRSMEQNAEKETGAAWSTGDCDPRVTKIGRYLRKTHIDELLQLYNVLLGQMSIIGPRPERPAFINKLSTSIEGYRERLVVPPGITGLAQVRQKHDESLDDVRNKLQYDREYIENISLSLDIRIIFETIAHMTSLFWESFKSRTVEKVAPKKASAVLGESMERQNL
jgi:lipopolysaccharide/colanic/teichoic acid biosynthesis glycosyltransferase